MKQTSKPAWVRTRAEPIRVMVDAAEKKLLARAARKLDRPLSTFVREAAVKEAKRVVEGG
jgi:uncharacterized protein (DUF1778 family)